MADEDVEINLRMAGHGAGLIQDGDTIIHHCNTGALAAVDWGTALGAIRMAHVQGKSLHVLVDETRPRLQGARLTAWELEQYGISYEIIPDNAAGYFSAPARCKRYFLAQIALQLTAMWPTRSAAICWRWRRTTTRCRLPAWRPLRRSIYHASRRSNPDRGTPC